MRYWRRKSLIMKVLSYAALAGTFFCLFTGMAFLSLLLLLFSFHFSTESELCKLRAVVIQLIDNQNVMMGVGFEENQRNPQR